MSKVMSSKFYNVLKDDIESIMQKVIFGKPIANTIKKT